MKPRKKRKKKTTSSPSLCPEDKILLESLLTVSKTELPANIVKKIPTPEIARALALSLPASGETTLPLLLSLQRAFDGKDVRKAVKRALFKLKKMGVVVPDRFERDPEPLLRTATAEKDAPEAFVGPIDGTGTRGVFVSIPQMPSGYEAGIGVISDEAGMIEFHAGAYSKKRLKELKRHLFDEMGVKVSASISHVLTILEKAYAESKERSLDLPSDYLRMRNQIIKSGTFLERPPIYELITEPDVSKETLTPSLLEKLFDHETMQTWLIGPDEIEPLLVELEEMEEGFLVLSEAQELDRIQSTKERWAEKAFPLSKLETLKHRLEEMAYIFHRSEDKALAELALSAAYMAQKKTPLESMNPLVSFLLEKSIAFYEALRSEAEDDQMEKETSHPLILT